MDRADKPLRRGVSASQPTADPHGRLEKTELPLRGAKSLSELEGDFAFFTPAVPYLYGAMSDAPLFDFQNEMKRPIVFYFRKFNWKLFHGLEARDNDPDWNYALWAIEKPLWPEFSNFYLSVTLADPARKLVGGVGLTMVPVVDPLAIANLTVFTAVPSIMVGAFGYNGSNGRLAIVAQPGGLLQSPPRLTGFAPDSVMREYARALFGGDAPVVAAQDTKLAGGL